MAVKKHKNAEDRPVPFLAGVVSGDMVQITPNGTAKPSGGFDGFAHEGGGHDAWERQTDQSWRNGGNSTGE